MAEEFTEQDLAGIKAEARREIERELAKERLKKEILAEMNLGAADSTEMINAALRSEGVLAPAAAQALQRESRRALAAGDVDRLAAVNDRLSASLRARTTVDGIAQ